MGLHSRRQHRHRRADERRGGHDRAGHARLPAGTGKQSRHQAGHLGGLAGHGGAERAASALQRRPRAPGAVLPGEPEADAGRHGLPRQVPRRLLRHAVHLRFAPGHRRRRRALRQTGSGARQAAAAGSRLQGREGGAAVPHRPPERARRDGAVAEPEEGRRQRRPAIHGLGLAGRAPAEERSARAGRLEPVPDLGRLLRRQHAGHQPLAVGRLRQQPAGLALRQGAGRAAHRLDPRDRRGQAQGAGGPHPGTRLPDRALRDVGRVQARVRHARPEGHRADQGRRPGHVEHRKP